MTQPSSRVHSLQSFFVLPSRALALSRRCELGHVVLLLQEPFLSSLFEAHAENRLYLDQLLFVDHRALDSSSVDVPQSAVAVIIVVSSVVVVFPSSSFGTRRSQKIASRRSRCLFCLSFSRRASRRPPAHCTRIAALSLSILSFQSSIIMGACASKATEEIQVRDANTDDDSMGSSSVGRDASAQSRGRRREARSPVQPSPAIARLSSMRRCARCSVAHSNFV